MLHSYLVYITTNQNKSTLYTGVTNSIQKRIEQHHRDSIGHRKTFAGRYNCYYIIYYEGFESIEDAIRREKEIKRWRREKKVKLIEGINPDWEFLNNQVI